MLSGFLAWLASSGASLILGFLAQVIRDTAADNRAAQAQRDLGAAQTASKINANTIEVKDAMESVARPSDDDVAGRLRTGNF